MKETCRSLARLMGIISAIFLSAVSGLGKDWPVYRGDIWRSGYTSEELPSALTLQWSYRAPHPPTPAWPPPARRSYWQRLDKIEARVTDDEAFHPVVVGDSIYFGSSTDDHVYCLDATNGRLRWAFCTDGPVRYAPAVWQDRLLIGSDDGWLYCLDAVSGDLVWKHRIAPQDRRIPGNGRLISAWPVRSGSLVDRGIVYATAGLYPQQEVFACALDVRDGTLVWKRKLEVSPQGYLLASSKNLYIPTGRSNPVVLELQSGRRVKQFDGVGGTFALIGGDEFISGRGNEGSLAMADADSSERIVTFKGSQMVVTPSHSILYDDPMLTVLDRQRYAQINRRIKRLSDEMGQLNRSLKSNPSGDSSSAVKAKLAQLAAELDRAKQSLIECRRFTTEIGECLSLVTCPNAIVVGRLNEVAAFDSRDGSLLWSATVEGRALGLAMANGRLFVSTHKGIVYAFGLPMTAPSPQTTGAAALVRPEISEKVRLAAKRALSLLPSSKGYAVVVGIGTGEFAYELTAQSQLQVVGIDRDSEVVDRARVFLRKAGVYGQRVTVHKVDGARLPFADYFANLTVASGSVEASWDLVELKRIQRPDGGVLWLTGVDSMVRRGALPGAGKWTHLYGSPENSSSSGDRRITGPLSLQWFGGPGPQPMVDRHLRGPAPLYDRGILVVPGENALIGVDAYNGSELWNVQLPQSQRYSMPYDAGYIGIEGDTICVGVNSECWLIDSADGKVKGKLRPPDAAVGTHWGYAALVDGQIFGSGQKQTASRTHPSHQQIDSDYRNAQPIVTSQSLFSVDPATQQSAWAYGVGAILNPTITVGGERVYFIENRNAKSIQHSTGRIPLDELLRSEAWVVSLAAETGRVIWERPLPKNLLGCHNILYLLYGQNRIVAAGSFLNSVGDSTYQVACMDASSGEVIWNASHDKGQPGQSFHGEQVHHPVILDSVLIAEPVLYELATGEPIYANDKTERWRLRRPGHSCGTLSAGGDCLFFRAQNPTMLDLKKNLAGNAQPQKLSPSRPGCWINIIPAGGLVMIPEASAGCVCHFSLQTSMAFVPSALAEAPSN